MKDANGVTVRHVIPVKHEISDYEMLLAAVRAGSGLAQLPLWLVGDDLGRGQLATVLDGMSGGEMPINILWPRMRTVPAKLRVEIDEVTRNVIAEPTKVVAS